MDGILLVGILSAEIMSRGFCIFPIEDGRLQQSWLEWWRDGDMAAGKRAVKTMMVMILLQLLAMHLLAGMSDALGDDKSQLSLRSSRNDQKS